MAFHNWYALFPPLEWNRGLWRYVEPGHRSGNGVVPRGVYGPHPHERYTGAAPASLGDQAHPVANYLSATAWWGRCPDLARKVRTSRPSPARGERLRAARLAIQPYLPLEDGDGDRALVNTDTPLPPADDYQAYLDRVAAERAEEAEYED